MSLMIVTEAFVTWYQSHFVSIIIALCYWWMLHIFELLWW